MSWWPVRIGTDEHHRWIEVRGPYRDSSGRVTGISAAKQSRWAQSMGARLPTVEEYTAMWSAAEVAVYANPRRPTSPLDALHSDVMNALIAHGEPTDRVCAGKTWVLHPRASNRSAVNFGWWVPPEQVRGARWKGTKVHDDGAHGWVIQPPSATHGYTHADYSQLGYAVRDMDPGYESVDDDPDTIPDPVSWRDPTIRWGERAVLFSMAEMRSGVREEPAGSNTGPRIREYLAPATRVINGKEVRLGLPSGNWCAAAYCYAERMTEMDGDEPQPYRVSGIELERDAQRAGLWLPVEDVRRGKARPRAGDGLVMTRGNRGGWERHVARLVRDLDGEGFTTIGGNEDGEWRQTARLLRDERLLGFLLHNS